jgi:hypothetical protein
MRRSGYTVAVAFLGTMLFGLVTAIVVVLAARAGRQDVVANPTPTAGRDSSSSDGSSDSGSRTPSPSQTPACHVGKWQVVEHRETVDLEPELAQLTGKASVEMTGGEGATVTLRADGTGQSDYNDTEYEGELAGSTIRIEVSGRITYTYTLTRNVVNTKVLTNTTKGQAYVNDEEAGEPEPLTSLGASTFTCSSTELTEKTAKATTTYKRLS